MADDIEATLGFDKAVKIEPDALAESDVFRNAIAGRFVQFFGSADPPAADMYTSRAQMADE
eukprot:103692-Heterocapsa_arctica.AAC.1